MPSLLQRTKWTKKERNIAVGDIVLIVDDKNPRGRWPTGRVTDVLPDKAEMDGNQTIRTVIIETEDGEYRRPVVKLCLLKPVEEEKANDQEETKKK